MQSLGQYFVSDLTNFICQWSNIHCFGYCAAELFGYSVNLAGGDNKDLASNVFCIKCCDIVFHADFLPRFVRYLYNTIKKITKK